MKNERRHDIDWVRVLAFDILILYHVGMFFVLWEWHVKNNVIVDWVRWPMLFVNQWRLPVLFVVSGMGTRFALSKKTGNQYIGERFTRLIIPLLAGILLIVPPQVYVERLSDGQFSGSFFEFYPRFFDGIYPEGNFSWHHLWFLPYLFIMSVLATPLFLNLRRDGNKIITWFRQILEKSPFNLFLFSVPLFIVEFSLKPFFPITHALIGDWYALAIYSLLFLTGFILISLGESFWTALDKIRFFALITGIISFLTLIWLWMNYKGSPFIPIFKVLNMWSWIIALLSFVSKYLNRESRVIKYRSQAVYPFYILHQTITVICGYYLINLSVHYLFKMLILILFTFGGSWLIYELVIQKVPGLKPLFGVK